MLGMCDKACTAVVLEVTSSDSSTEVIEWKPYGAKASVLDVFFAPQLGSDLVFTCGLDAVLTLWRLPPATGECSGANAAGTCSASGAAAPHRVA